MEIFAHRGFSSEYPENTLLAFKKAYEVGAHGIELDVRLTKDQEVVVIHDSSVDRTTNGSGAVNELTLAEIQKLDAGSWKGIAFENEPVPTLKTVLDVMGGKLTVNIEMKHENDHERDPLVKRVLELIYMSGYQDNVILSSFDFKCIVVAKEQMPNIAAALIPTPGFRGVLARHLFKHSAHVDALHPSLHEVNENLVKNEHLSHRKVRVWTVDDSYDMMRMERMGVDAIMTNDPLLGLVYSRSGS